LAGTERKQETTYDTESSAAADEAPAGVHTCSSQFGGSTTMTAVASSHTCLTAALLLPAARQAW
jgi:hypothetical protein